MPDNGVGVYVPPSTGFPFVNETLADGPTVSTIITDIAAALSNRICKDGQTSITANIPMNGFKMTNMAPGTARLDSANLGNIQDGAGVFVSSVSGTGDAIVLAPAPGIASYTAGQCFRFVAIAANTTAVTVQVSGLTAIPLKLTTGMNLIGGDVPLGALIEITYDGTEFLLTGPGAESPLTGQTLTSPILATGTVTADPTTALGVASKQYVDALWTTGDVKLTFKTTADSGWILMNDGSIGSATSGATTRANADTSALYTLLWTNVSDTYAPVSTGRGATAAADFSANKTLTLTKTLGRMLGVYGAGSGLTSRSLGQTLGAETHQLTVAETPVPTFDTGLYGAGANTGLQDQAGNATPSAFSIMPPVSFLNAMIKL